MSIQFYFAEDVVNPYNGEVLYLVGEAITEEVIEDLKQHDIFSYDVATYPIMPEQDQDQTEAIVTEYLGLIWSNSTESYHE